MESSADLRSVQPEPHVPHRDSTGQGLPPEDITGTYRLGNTIIKPDPKVPFTTPIFEQYANEIATDEKNHVEYLRATLSAFGETPVARPPLDLLNSFNTLAQAAGIGDTFDPFASEENFFLGAFIFEDVGVTAYRGGAKLLTNIDLIFAAAGVLGTEAYHAANIRNTVLGFGDSAIDTAQKISDLRDLLDGEKNDDQGVILRGVANISRRMQMGWYSRVQRGRCSISFMERRVCTAGSSSLKD